MTQAKRSRRKQPRKLDPESLRSITITVRVTRAEFEVLDNQAILEHVSMSELIRRQILPQE